MALKITTRGRKGLLAMLELARHFGDPPVRMSTVAESQEISRKHLHALLTDLKSAGLVRSVRGPGGGFVLTRPPVEIRLSEIVNALEGPLSLAPCLEQTGSCEKAERCAAHKVWHGLNTTIEEYLSNTTLAEMAAMDDSAGSGAKRAGKPGTGRRN